MLIKRNDSCKYITNKLGMIIYKFENQKLKNAIEVNRSASEIIELANGDTTYEDILTSIQKKHNIKDTTILAAIEKYIDYLIGIELLLLTDEIEKSKKVDGDSSLIIPTQISFEITKLCQLKCIHCFNSSGKCIESEASYEKIIEILKKFADLGTLQVLLTGGEPLLKDRILDIIDFCCNNFYEVTIGTNAVAINDEMLECFSKYDNLSFTISIDGKEQTHDYLRGVKGSYSKAVENIKKLIKKGFSVQISYTMSEYNYREAASTAKFMKLLGCDGINLGYILNRGRAKENSLPIISTKEYLKTMNEVYIKYNDDTFDAVNESCDTSLEDIFLESIPYKNKCGAGYREISIKSDGSVYPCPTCEDIKIGNIIQSTFEEVLGGDFIQNMLNLESPCEAKCGDCEHLPLCKNCISRVLEKEKNCKLRDKYYEQKIINNKKC